MGIFRRSREHRNTAGVDHTAIPLTPAEMAILVEALYEDDRLTRLRRPDIGGSRYATGEANAHMRNAGVAAALGHSTIPVLVTKLRMLQYVHETLQQYAPGGRHEIGFRRLLARMHALEGMARVHRWKAVRTDAGVRWPTNAPNPVVTHALAIETRGAD